MGQARAFLNITVRFPVSAFHGSFPSIFLTKCGKVLSTALNPKQRMVTCLAKKGLRGLRPSEKSRDGRQQGGVAGLRTVQDSAPELRRLRQLSFTFGGTPEQGWGGGGNPRKSTLSPLH